MSAKSPEFVYICDPQTNGQGSLSGLRLGVKDLFHIAGMPTTAGNPDWMSSHSQPATVTAPTVTALLEAGATLIGKTLTDELAYSLEGINKHYGTPINPQAPARIPGGSSSGSAVAVANGTIDIGLGTDTGGSIRVPASYNGLYGLRPSHGVVSCDHLVPLAPSFDTVGWMTRDFSTLIRVAEVLLPPTKHNNLSHLVVGNIEGIESWLTAREPLLTAIANQFESVKEIEISQDHLTMASNAFRVLQGREIWQAHGKWIEEQQPDLATEIRDRFMWCKNLTFDDEQQAKNQAQKFIDFWHSEVLSSINQVLLLPTTPGAAPLLNTAPSQQHGHRTKGRPSGSKHLGFPQVSCPLQYRNFLLGLTAPAGLTKAPQISLPYLSSEQAPWGVSLMALSGCDRALLACVIDTSRNKWTRILGSLT